MAAVLCSCSLHVCCELRRQRSADACWSPLHPWILRRVGVHGRATVTDGLGAPFVVPGFVAVDLAQPVRSALCGQPPRGIGGPYVARVARYVSRRGAVGPPWARFGFGAVLRDRLAAELVLVSGGAPAAV